MKALSLSILAILLISSFAFVSHAAVPTFSPPVKLGAGFDPNVKSVGNNVYVTWTDKSGGIMFAASTNSGNSFSPAIKVGPGGQYPIMSTSGSNVYIVWASNGINFVASASNGATGSWSKPMKLAAAGSITPFITSDGAVVSVVYLSGTGGSFVTSSSDSGKTWTTPFQFSNGPEPQIAVSGSNIYVSADELNRAHIQFAVSHDAGLHWKITALAGGSESWLVASGSNVYAAWETKGTHSVVWFMSSTNNGDNLTTRIISTSIPDAWNPMINAIGSNVWIGIEAFGAQTQNWMLTSTNGGASFAATSVSGLGHINGFIFSDPTTDGSNVYAMWLEAVNNTASDVMVTYSPNGGVSWSTTSIGHADPNGDVAIGSMSANGVHAFAAWQENSAIMFASN